MKPARPASHHSVRRVVEAEEPDDDDDVNDTEIAKEEEPKQKRITGEISDYTGSFLSEELAMCPITECTFLLEGHLSFKVKINTN